MKTHMPIRILLTLLALLAVSVAAQAQATRTWVSGVGDDANPCSRTAPCKTFAGAISKTAPGGEINVLDPGGFGAVTITKALTISNDGVGSAGVLVSGTNGIVVSAGVSDVVVLRGLDIEGLGTGLAGIKVLQAGAVHVEKCTINNFTQIGIDFSPTSATTATSQLFVSHTIIRDNNGASSGGIRIKPGSNVNARAMIEETQLSNNNFGLRADASGGGLSTNVTVQGGSASGNLNASLVAVGGGTTLNTTIHLMIDGTAISNNGFGPRADGATVRFGNTTVTGNGTGVSAVNGGQLLSYGNNRIDGNTADGTSAGFPTVIPQK
jgi:hypothetical protein